MVPGTVIVVQENLPSGMAAAVIDRAHTDRDLVCFLDAGELTAFSAVDGATPLHAIPGASAELFQRLWLHDLVMIDASHGPEGSRSDTGPEGGVHDRAG
jgi:hypothetical protein